MQQHRPARAPLFTSLLVVGMLAALFLAAPAGARSFETGVLDIDAYYEGSEIPFRRTEAAGASYVKANIFWTIVAPDMAVKPRGFDPTDPGDPHYSWARYDRVARSANRAGLDVIFTVSNSPRWARKHCGGSSACAPRASDYAGFARAVAARYGGTFDPGDGKGTLPRVRHFQAWTEPNLNYFFRPVFRGGRPVSPRIYRGMLNAFYRGIKSVRRTNLVLTAGLAPLARPGATIGPLEFMRRLLCLGGPSHDPRPLRGCRAKTMFDIWAVHPYTTGGPTYSAPGPDDVALGDLAKVARTLRVAERSGKIARVGAPRRTSIWATEFSYDSNPPDPGGLKNFIHAHWSSEAMFRMYRAGIDTLVWFGYRDEAPKGRPHCEVFDSGLFRRGATFSRDRPKPFFRAFRFPFVSFRTGNGLFVWGRTPDSRRGPVLIQLRDGRGGFRRVARVRAGANGVFQTRFRVRGGASSRGKVRARARGGASIPYSLSYVRDFHQPPFGQCAGGGGGRPNSP